MKIIHLPLNTIGSLFKFILLCITAIGADFGFGNKVRLPAYLAGWCSGLLSFRPESQVTKWIEPFLYPLKEITKGRSQHALATRWAWFLQVVFRKTHHRNPSNLEDCTYTLYVHAWKSIIRDKTFIFWWLTTVRFILRGLSSSYPGMGEQTEWLFNRYNNIWRHLQYFLFNRTSILGLFQALWARSVGRVVIHWTISPAAGTVVTEPVFRHDGDSGRMS